MSRTRRYASYLLLGASLAGLALIALARAEDNAQPANGWKESTVNAQYKDLPPIERERPQRTEIATFAMG